MKQTPDAITAFPLAWPMATPRRKPGTQTYSLFKTNQTKATDEIKHAVRALGGSKLIISSNITVRADGSYVAVKYPPKDSGVAVYFERKNKNMVFACDRWFTVPENLHAIYLTIEAIRGIERWGSGQMLEAAFTGFLALAAPEQPFQVLGISSHATETEIREAHRLKIWECHPDRPGGGDPDRAGRINAARDSMLDSLESRDAAR